MRFFLHVACEHLSRFIPLTNYLTFLPSPPHFAPLFIRGDILLGWIVVVAFHPMPPLAAMSILRYWRCWLNMNVFRRYSPASCRLNKENFCYENHTYFRWRLGIHGDPLYLLLAGSIAAISGVLVSEFCVIWICHNYGGTSRLAQDHHSPEFKTSAPMANARRCPAPWLTMTKAYPLLGRAV